LVTTPTVSPKKPLTIAGEGLSEFVVSFAYEGSILKENA
jgi:hypothetical protein